uniref:SFRICE_015079 n=1 Tax=Spodoptera frugiperda TaxID=7108 RepID=A0A2H1WHM6_SPOFR
MFVHAHTTQEKILTWGNVKKKSQHSTGVLTFNLDRGQFLPVSPEALRAAASGERWSALLCLYHLGIK